MRIAFGPKAGLAYQDAAGRDIAWGLFSGFYLDTGEHVGPTLDELIEVCARAIEDDPDVNDAELAIDGVSRLCAESPDDFAARTSPLKKRASRSLLVRARAPGLAAWASSSRPFAPRAT